MIVAVIFVVTVWLQTFGGTLVHALTSVTTLFSHRGLSVSILTAMLEVLGDVVAELFTLSASSSLFSSALMTAVQFAMQISSLFVTVSSFSTLCK